MLERSALADGDELTATLERIADAAEDQARAQIRVAAAARAAARKRTGGPLSEATGRRVREVLDLVATSTERMVGAAGELRRVWAATLAAQGLSGREIAIRLGVSHQRVSVLLGRGPAAGV